MATSELDPTVGAGPEWQPTACILCECNCGIEVQLEGRRLARIRGDKAHPASQGYTCNKAMRLDHYQNGRDRLTSPLRRRSDGSYEEIDWDTAIAEVAERLSAVRDAHGGETIFYYGGGGQGNHLGGAYSRALLAALGARYRSSALAQEKMGEGWVDGHLYGGHTRGDFEHAEVAVFIGKNPWQSQSLPRARVTLRELAQGPGARARRDRPGADRDGRDGRRPPPGAPGHRRVVPRRAARDRSFRSGSSTTPSSPSTRPAASRCSPRSPSCRSPSTPRAAASTSS